MLTASAGKLKWWLHLLAAAAALAPFTARAWDATGHMLVDLIALEQLKPGIADKLEPLIKKLGDKHNGGHPYNFITAGCYLDDTRSEPGYPYTKWHYVDVPYTPAASPFSVPQPPHVLSGIEQAIDTLRNAQAPQDQRAQALAMLMHFVGDVHQPLHCATWNDEGGILFYIKGIPFSDIGKQAPTLHTYWDKAFRFDAQNGNAIEIYHGVGVQDRPRNSREGLIKDEGERIISQFPPTSLYQLQEHKTPRSWAEESYTIACLFTYPPGPHPGDAEVVTLSPEYVHKAHDIACQRLALAGYRLGQLLNELFGSSPQ